MPLSIHRSEYTKLHCGDCCKVIPKLQGTFDLIFADPPFNIGHKYNGYDDNKSDHEYERFTGEWVGQCNNVLRPGGTIAIHAPDSLVPQLFELAKGFNLRQVDWIIWHYRFGQSGSAAKSSKCITSKAHLLVFTKPGGDRTWNPPLVPSDRATKYSDPRTTKTETPGMRVALDVWGVPSDGPYWGRVQGNDKERCGNHPNQLRELYVARAMRAWSNEGDRVLCPFAGSGTEMVVAEALKRHIVGIEISPENFKSIKTRIAKGAVRRL